MPPNTIEQNLKGARDLVDAKGGTLTPAYANDSIQNAKGSKSTVIAQPTISANDLANPVPTVNPPVPSVSTNDGSRTQGLVSNVADNTQSFIQSQSEEAKKAKELAGLLGNQEFDGQGQRAKLGEQYGIPDNLTRLTDIQTQLSRANTASDVQKVKIGGGNSIAQGNREITQQDRENAIRTAGLAAEAAVLQGSIETASTLINSAMTDYYADRQAKNQSMIQQLNYFSGVADKQTAQLLTKEARKYEEDQTNIKRAQNLVDGAVSSGYLAGSELQNILAVTDPASQAEMTQMIIARGIQKDIADAKAAAASGGFDSPETKNFGTSDAPIWKQWNATTGTWEDVTGVAGGGADSPEAIQQSLDQLSFLRDTAQRIIGGEQKDEEGNVIDTYDPLYEASGPSGVSKFLGDTFVGDTDYRRLETYSDTLRTNVLALMTDPSVKKFFGPQMSNADVKLMSATGSTIRPESQSPSEIKSEVLRLDDLLNRMQTAVKNGTQGQVQGPVQAVNVITAPDGTQIEIID